MTLNSMPQFSYGEMLYLRYMVCSDIPFTTVMKANTGADGIEPDSNAIQIGIVKKLKSVLPPGTPKPKPDLNHLWAAVKDSASR